MGFFRLLWVFSGFYTFILGFLWVLPAILGTQLAGKTWLACGPKCG
jgi:hypothetical protein